MQSPMMESAERAAETIPGLAAAAAAVGLQDHQRMLRDAATRLQDSYNIGRGALLAEQPKQMKDDDDMGDIVITGDIKILDPSQASSILDSLRAKKSDAPPVAVPLPAKRKWKWGIPASIITAGAMTAAGLSQIALSTTTNEQQAGAVDVGFGKPVDVSK